jgi:hypothetical protein
LVIELGPTPKNETAAPLLPGPRDMITFSLYEFYVALRSIRERRDTMHDWGLRHGQTEALTKSTRTWVLVPLQLLQQACDRVELCATSQRLKEIQYRLEGVTPGCTYQIIEAELQGLETTLVADLERHAFAYIPLGRVRFCEHDSLFGERAKKALPSADYDIREAGNCLAVGAFTASVFHLMRVVERCLRALAKERHVTFGDPIELQQWQQIIDGIEQSVTALLPTLSRKARTEARTFYYWLWCARRV